MKRVIVHVSGRVQGVGYRYYVMECGQQAGVTGYVRNMADGSVEVIAEGSEESLLNFIRYIDAKGELVICVDHLEIEWGAPTGEFSGFGIKR
ncbi:MAG: acylphosphatase [Methanoregulaceae archaeon]|jgi:acylphosphatase|nr:acylphosphatase [Methanoregulaceae archaeon]